MTQVEDAALPVTREPPAAAPGNTIGRLLCLTMFTPIRAQWLPVLVGGFWLGKWFKTFHHDVLQFNFIHYVRWAIVRDLPYHGPPQERDRLNYRYLLFESNFDGPWQHYIDAFAYVIPLDIRVTWGRGPGFPAPPPAEPLKAWIAHNSMEGGTYYCAHAEFSTREVNNAIAVSARLRALQRDAGRLDPQSFKAEWERFLTDAQAHL